MLRSARPEAGDPCPTPHAALGAALAVLTAANVLNNRVSPRTVVPVSLGSAGALLLIAHRAGLSREELGLGTARLRPGLRAGGLAAAGVGALYTAGALLPLTRPLFADGRAEQRLTGLLRQALVDVPLGTVLLEETGFRCVLPALLRRAYGPGAGEAVPVALFGLWHVLPSAALTEANPALSAATTGGAPSRTAEAAGAVLTTSVGGAVFALMRRRTGSVAAPALLHAAFNSLGYVAAWAVRRAHAAGPGG